MAEHDRVAAAARELADALRAELEAAQAPAAPPRLRTIQEAADYLRVARSTVYEAINAGKLATIKVGSRRLVSELELLRIARGWEAEAGDAGPRPRALPPSREW